MKVRLLLVLMFLLTMNRSFAEEKPDSLYQVSTINALMEKIYDGHITFKHLKKHGDIGLGTLNGINGEMIAIDGHFYNVRTDGKVYKVSEKSRTPFAVVTFFDADAKFPIKEELNFSTLKTFLDYKLPTKNLFYAFRIDAKFKYIKARSVPEASKPFPSLVDIVQHQTVFEFKDIEGSLVGFKCPEYAKGINITGYHIHFISSDRKSGGHLLDCNIDNGTALVDYISEVTVILPENKAFYQAELSDQKQEDIDIVEKNPQ